MHHTEINRRRLRRYNIQSYLPNNTVQLQNNSSVLVAQYILD